MYSPADISNLIYKVRSELGLCATLKPKIVETYYDREANSLFIIAADRPDKSAVLGPGGWVLSLIRKKLGVTAVGVRSKLDLEAKKQRIKLAAEQLRRLSQDVDGHLRKIIDSRLLPMLKNELNYPARTFFERKPLKKHALIIALSGGVDSTTALVLAWKAGLNPIAITMSPGTWLIPAETRRIINTVVSRLGVHHEYIDSTKAYEEMFRDALKGKIHPCGRCHTITATRLIEIAKNRKIPLIGFGDLLPTGTYSSYIVEENLVRFNIPASLSLSKIDTILTARQFGHPGASFVYGCPLIREVHRRYPQFCYASLHRVLRETRAGILEPGQALKYVKNIMQLSGKKADGQGWS